MEPETIQQVIDHLTGPTAETVAEYTRFKYTEGLVDLAAGFAFIVVSLFGLRAVSRRIRAHYAATIEFVEDSDLVKAIFLIFIAIFFITIFLIGIDLVVDAVPQIVAPEASAINQLIHDLRG